MLKPRELSKDPIFSNLLARDRLAVLRSPLDELDPSKRNGTASVATVADALSKKNYVSVALTDAQDLLDGDPLAVTPGALYAITGTPIDDADPALGTWNDSGLLATVYVVGLNPSAFDVSGALLQVDGTIAAVTVDVAAGTYKVQAGGGTAEYISTENLGGISAGDKFSTSDPAMVQLLIKYQRPGFSNFNVAGKADRVELVGTQFDASFKSAVWDTTNDDNIKPNSITIRDVTANTILASNEANDGVASLLTAAFTVALGQSRVYLISGVDTQSNTFFETVTISGLFQSFFGYINTNGPLDMPTLLGLGNDVLQGGKSRTLSGVTAGPGLYTVYAWPSTGSDDIGQILQDGVDSIRGAFGPVRYATGPNSLGAMVTMGYIISNATRAFTNSSLAFI